VLRTARLQGRWRLEDVAERMGVSLFTVVELGALWALKRFDRD
jgi:hypothetical protein